MTAPHRTHPLFHNASIGACRHVAVWLVCACCASAWAQTGQAAASPDSEAPVVYERVVSGNDAEASAAPVIEGEELLPEGEPEAPRSAVRIYQQDAGSRVEELRVRGETQEITVTPSGNMPSYEVRPNNSRTYQTQSGRHSSDGTTGPRRWKIGEF